MFFIIKPMVSSVSDPLIGSYFIEENTDSDESDDDSIKLIKFIGSGGFGSVYTTIWSGRLVAVKLSTFDSGIDTNLNKKCMKIGSCWFKICIFQRCLG